MLVTKTDNKKKTVVQKYRSSRNNSFTFPNVTQCLKLLFLHMKKREKMKEKFVGWINKKPTYGIVFVNILEIDKHKIFLVFKKFSFFYFKLLTIIFLYL